MDFIISNKTHFHLFELAFFPWGEKTMLTQAWSNFSSRNFLSVGCVYTEI